VLNQNLAAIIVNRNGGELVLSCLDSLVRGSVVPGLIYLIDNASEDGSAETAARRFPQVTLLRHQANLGYAAALNRGLQKACEKQPGLVLLMNNDVIVEHDAVGRLVERWHANAGLLGPKVLLLDDPNKLDAAWGKIRFHHVVCTMIGEGDLDSETYSHARRVDALLGCMLLTHCSVLKQVGMLDTDYFMYMEEIDLAYRIGKTGKEILFVPEARARHAGGHAWKNQDRGRLKTHYVRRNAIVFLRKHGTPLRWCKFSLFACASLLSCLLSFRWNDLKVRWNGYREGFKVRLT
jgi:hypothetical protein